MEEKDWEKHLKIMNDTKEYVNNLYKESKSKLPFEEWLKLEIEKL